MTRPRSLASIFHRARDLPPGEEREAYLEAACGGDPSLRAQLDSLLRSDVEENAVLDRAQTHSSRPVGEVPGQVIGRYKLLQQIGEGGFGTVWMAQQREPVKRRVALKVIKLGMDTKQVIARFEAERQALAMMEHESIAKVFDAGATEAGRPFFVMELVNGIPIVEYCDSERLTTADRLALFVQVCQAIQHAHQKGIIHRDIKPANVLVTLHDGVPVPKVIDFGVAKATNQELTERTLFTEFQQIVGTPAYMSPEQAEMTGLGIDTRADVYALGVLLYELLTGTTPIDVKSLLAIGYNEMLRAIREDEPRRPSARISTQGKAATNAADRRRTDVKRLGSLLLGDLDWIVMKCLEKDRSRRYDTASGLAADIARHLDHEPVSARPPSGSYRFRKFLRRHRLAATAALAVALATVGGAIFAGLGYVAAAGSASEAFAALRRSEGERLSAIATGFVEDDPTLALLLAREGGRLSPGAVARSALLTALAHHLESATLDGHDAYVIDARFDPSGERLLSVAQEPAALIWDLQSRSVVHRLRGHTGALTGGVFDDLGARVLTSSVDGTACLFDARTGDLVMRLDDHRGTVHRARFSPDGKQVLTSCEDGRVRIFDAVSGRVTRSLDGHTDQVLDAIWLPDGRGVASISFDDTVRIWRPDSEVPLIVRIDVSGVPERWSYSGDWLATADDGRLLLVWQRASGASPWAFDLMTGEPVPYADPSGANPLAWNGGAGRVASLVEGPDGVSSVEVWDTSTSTSLWRDRPRGSIHARFLDDEGRYLGLWSGTSAVFEVVDLEAGEVIARCPGHRYAILNLAMSPDQRQVVSTSADGAVRVWDLDRARRRDVLRAVEWPAAQPIPLLTREHPLIVLTDGGRAQSPLVVDLAGETVGAARTFALDVLPGNTRIASNADRLVVLESEQRAVVVDVASGAVKGVIEISDGRFRSAFLSPDGSHLALSLHPDQNQSYSIRVYEVSSGRQLGPASQLPSGSSRFCCTNDGVTLLTAHGTELPVVIIWDVLTGRELRRCIGHTGHIVDLVITPDGDLAASRGVDDKVILWDVATAKARAVCVGVPKASGSKIALRDDGEYVAAFTDEAVMLFDARTGELWAQGKRPSGDGHLLPGRFTARGDVLITPDSERRLWFWPVDPQEASASLAPREISWSELQRFRIGTQQERDERLHAWVDSHHSSRALCAWGDRCLENGDLDSARAAFDRALELRGFWAEGHLGHARLHARRAEAAADVNEREAQVNQGLAALDRALEHGRPGRILVPDEGGFDVLRADPRFSEILARHGR